MNSLKNHFIISVPHLNDPLFEKAVIYLCQHDSQGAIGLIINKVIDYNNISLKDSTSDDKFNKYFKGNYFYIGGPVLTNRILFLHNSHEISNSIHISAEVSISGDIEKLNSIQKSKEFKCKMFLGHAGWNNGQLEREIENGDWLIQESNADLIFEKKVDNIWLMATTSLGIEIDNISNTSGYS